MLASLILSACLLGPVKVDYEARGNTMNYKTQESALYVIQNEKDLEKVGRMIQQRDYEFLRVKEIDWKKQVGFFAISPSSKRPDCVVDIEEIERQGPVVRKGPNGYTFDEIQVRVTMNYIRGERVADFDSAGWSFNLVSRDNLKEDQKGSKASPITKDTHVIMFKAHVVSTLEDAKELN